MIRTPVHIPVLGQEVVQAFYPSLTGKDCGIFIDGTFGGGGHSRMLMALNPHIQWIGVDQDLEALGRARENFKLEIESGRLRLVHRRLSEVLQDETGFQGLPCLGILADIGFSSDQIESSERGLSFLREGPLDMRLDPHRGIPCSEWLAQNSEEEIERVLREYGEERFSKFIARTIAQAITVKKPPSTTKELAQLVVHAIPSRFRHGKIHAATRTFQALRIAVNQELEELDAILSHGILRLSPGGRLGVISFHSLEDRRVKRAFRNLPDGYARVSKKAIQASREEQRENPRSRTAKFRVVECQQNGDFQKIK